MDHILCVDDQPEHREEIAAQLRRRGYAVEAVSTPSEALTRITADPYHFDIVLTDLDFGRTEQNNGIWLVQQVLRLRESRGYDAAPEIISLTGKMIDSDVLNRLQALGVRYVLKGQAESYLIEVAAASSRLARFRAQGPTVLLVHTCSSGNDADLERRPSRFACFVGEAVNSAYILSGDARIKIGLSPAPLLVLDYLGRRAVRRSLRLEEIANGLNAEEFYYYWLGREQEHTVSSDSVKMNIRRIRRALAEALTRASITIDSDKLLVSETVGEDSDEFDSEGTAYRLRANVRVEHTH